MREPGWAFLLRVAGVCKVPLAFLLFAPAAALAASTCYDESGYPAIGLLEAAEGGIRAGLGTLSEGCRTSLSAIKFTDGRGWETDVPIECGKSCCGERKSSPGVTIPPIEMTEAEARRFLPGLANVQEGGPEQKIGASTEQGGSVWFGITFYKGEGSYGIGGIGRYDPATGTSVIRRPEAIRPYSIDSIAHDGKSLWLSTTGHYECLGDPPALGLVRYDWETDRLDTFVGRDDGPCGFVVHDLLLDAKYLWVATDLGLSRRDRATGAWEHFVPAPGSSPPMQPTSCEALYTRLLNSLTREAIDEGDIIPHSQLFEALTNFRPRFLAEYVQSMPMEKRGCDELKYLGRTAPEFATFKEKVLDLETAPREQAWCALDGFRASGSRDPAWRDFLLAHPQFASVELLARFAPDAKIAEVLVQRIATKNNPWEEMEALPSMMGDKSVPVLMSALDRFQKEDGLGLMTNSVMIGLMKATHMVLWPDGKQTKPPPNLECESAVIFSWYFNYADVDESGVADQWRAWWTAHKQEFETGQEPDGHSAPSPPTD